MARPQPVKLTATTTEAVEYYGDGLEAVHIKNQGNEDCLIDFDNAISANSYLLEAGEVICFESRFLRLHYKASANTTVLYTIKEQQ